MLGDSTFCVSVVRSGQTGRQVGGHGLGELDEDDVVTSVLSVHTALVPVSGTEDTLREDNTRTLYL